MGLNNGTIRGDWYQVNGVPGQRRPQNAPTRRQLRREAEHLARKEAKKQQSAQNGFLN